MAEETFTKKAGKSRRPARREEISAEEALPETEKAKELRQIKEKRDVLNKKTSELVKKNRQTINALNDFYEDAKTAKKLRDEKNLVLKGLKEKKNALLVELNALKAKVFEREETIRNLRTMVTMPLFELTRKIKALDWRIQTEAVSGKIEKQMSQEIKKLEKQLPRAKELEDAYALLNVERKALGEKSFEVSTHLRNMDSLSRESGNFHEELMNSYKKANSLKEKLSSDIQKVSEFKNEADSEHKKVVEIVNSLKTQEEREEAANSEALKKQKEDYLQIKTSEISTKAKAIFEQFKQGKKLSFEELQILQASNLL